MNPSVRKPLMSEDFDSLYTSTLACCGDIPEWEWDEEEMYFSYDCGCLKTQTLRPKTGHLECDSVDVEHYDED